MKNHRWLAVVFSWTDANDAVSHPFANKKVKGWGTGLLAWQLWNRF
jgi:hypothetical protein